MAPFSIYFNHGGRFISFDNDIVYVGGEIKAKHGLDSDRIGYFDLLDEVDQMGYILQKLSYQVPGTNLREGLRVLKDDTQVMEMLQYLGSENEFFNIYVEGDKSTAIRGSASGSRAANAKESIQTEPSQVTQTQAFTAVGVQDAPEEIEVHYEGGDTYDYHPVENSDTDDGLEDNELSDDEEYIEARQNKVKFRNYVPIDEVADRLNSHRGFVFPNKKAKASTTKDQHGTDSEGFNSEYEDSDGDVNSVGSSEEDEQGYRRREKRVVYDPRCDHKAMELVLGMRFEDGHQCKHAVQKWAILNGYNIKVVRSSKKLLEYKCAKNCQWKLFGSIIRKEKSFAIKTLVPGHICHREMKNGQASASFIAREYIGRFRRNPNWSVPDLQDDLMEKFAVEVTMWKCYRAKWKALDLLRGSIFYHYALLRSYKAELMRVDRHGRFEFMLEGNGTFKAFFVSFSALRNGFLKGCRRIIGFDGCFLKTFLGGALLCATSKDGNNQMFPICWAVVESENEFFWTWFLKIMFEELQIIDGLGWTFVSDQQKGLINAIRNLTPYAEHRNCARHVYCNWKKDFKGQTMKNIFWKCVRSTYEAQLNGHLDELKEENEAAYYDFLKRDPSKFCKFHISELPKCDMVDNNVSETFNGYIVKARGRPIIDMLEDIRCALMERMHEKLMEMSSCQDVICPRIRTKLEDLKFNSRLCSIKPAVGGKFQIGLREDGFVVDINRWTCSCRAWQLTGIPCLHACASIHYLDRDTIEFVDSYFSVEKYVETYKNALEPLNGKKMWPSAEGNPIKPPVFKKMPGRPKKNRRKAPTEEPKNPTKMSRRGIQMTCTKCGGVGHNKRTCIARPSVRPPKLPVRRGRPPLQRTQYAATAGSSSGPASGGNVGTPIIASVGAASGNVSAHIGGAASASRGSQVNTRSGKNKATSEIQYSKGKNKRVAEDNVPQVPAKVKTREHRLVKQGYGVRIFEETGNIYMRLPNQTNVKYVSGSMATARAAKKSSVPSTSSVPTPSYARGTQARPIHSLPTNVGRGGGRTGSGNKGGRCGSRGGRVGSIRSGSAGCISTQESTAD